jgi:GrpB protein
MIRKVEVVPHAPNWLNLFETESKQIAIALGENIIEIYHIGSRVAKAQFIIIRNKIERFISLKFNTGNYHDSTPRKTDN